MELNKFFKKGTTVIISSLLCISLSSPVLALPTAYTEALSAGLIVPLKKPQIIVPPTFNQDISYDNFTIISNENATTNNAVNTTNTNTANPNTTNTNTANPNTTNTNTTSNSVKEYDVSRSSNGTPQQVLKTAIDLLGTPYVYGANGPNAFDCSAYVKHVYSTVGVELPRVAQEQSNCGVLVEKDNLQPGDLVFFGYYGGNDINHVGIYVGDSEFIHASSGSNGVVYSNLNESYYSTNYKFAKRILR